MRFPHEKKKKKKKTKAPGYSDCTSITWAGG
jgi:hypothetical protein